MLFFIKAFTVYVNKIENKSYFPYHQLQLAFGIRVRHYRVSNQVTFFFNREEYSFFPTPVNVIRYTYLEGWDKQTLCLIYSHYFLKI